MIEKITFLNFLVYGLSVVLTMLFVSYIIRVMHNREKSFMTSVMKRQSNIHEIIKNSISKESINKKEKITQSKKNNQKNMIRVVFYDGKAYWISDNVFYVAETNNGRVDSSTITPISAENMSKKEVEIMMQIIDNLRGDGI